MTTLRAKIGEEGVYYGLELLRTLYGLSQPTERQSLELMTRNCAEKWTTINPCYALALICVTDALKIKIPDAYNWPITLELAHLSWQPFCISRTSNNSDMRSRKEVIEVHLNELNIRALGPRRESTYMLLSLQQASDDSLAGVEERWSIKFCPINITEIVTPFIETQKLYEP